MNEQAPITARLPSGAEDSDAIKKRHDMLMRGEIQAYYVQRDKRGNVYVHSYPVVHTDRAA